MKKLDEMAHFPNICTLQLRATELKFRDKYINRSGAELTLWLE